MKSRISRYIRKRESYFINRGVPGPAPTFLFGNLGEIFLNDGPLQLVKWTKEYGKTYGIMEGGIRTLVTSDLDILNDVFVKKFANFHGRKVFYPQNQRSETKRLSPSQWSPIRTKAKSRTCSSPEACAGSANGRSRRRPFRPVHCAKSVRFLPNAWRPSCAVWRSRRRWARSRSTYIRKSR